MRIAILGGDGYLGWATAMHLSAAGHDIAVCDNFLRRRLNAEFASEPLFPVPDLTERAAVWEKHTGRSISVATGDLTDWEFARSFIEGCSPQAIVHYAELPSAPFSMANQRCSALALHNNLGVTHNLIHAVHELCPNAHIIKLGTMGEYGTPNIDIEEGWIEIDHKGRRDRFLYPRQGGSLYHTTKIMDTDLLWFYVRAWNLRVTDLMQGPVYGATTEESSIDPALMPHFSYDGVFGTVLNRFIVQAVANIPLTVFGRGTQRRGFLNIKDTVQCIRLVAEAPPAPGELRICNQFVDVFSVLDLAERVADAASAVGIGVTIDHLANPRMEAETHYYEPIHSALPALGLEPHHLTQDVLIEMLGVVRSFRDRIDTRHVLPTIRWDRQAASVTAPVGAMGRTAPRRQGKAEDGTLAPARSGVEIAAPDAYRLAVFLAARFGADTIIDIGRRCLSDEFPRALAATTLGLGPDADRRRRLLSKHRWIAPDIWSGHALELSPEVLSRSVVVCANLLEDLPDPIALIRRLVTMSKHALAIIITTPERATAPGASSGSQSNPAARGWTLSTFLRLLKQHGIRPTCSGLTASSDLAGDKRNIVVVIDHCPLEAGRAVPAEFRPLALMATYNDHDIAPQVVAKLLDDGVDVYVRDNWSSDETFEQLSAMARTRPGLSVGRFPEHGPSPYHDYLGLLGWKEQVAARHSGRWIVSVDSDEIRGSPWADVSFRGGLYICELMGFTAADLTVLNFCPVVDGFGPGVDPEQWFRHFEFGRSSHHFHQIKTWRQGKEQVNLRQSGGHEARFEGRKIFPYKFLLKHYSLRSTAQARRKVFTDRRPRYSPVTRARGWHTQYDHFGEDDKILRNPSSLIAFDDEGRSEYVVELVSGIGVDRAVAESSTVDDIAVAAGAAALTDSGTDRHHG
jgi:UDP-sulfoquinovose synthase